MKDNEETEIALACERETIVIALSDIEPLKPMRAGTKESNKYAQILASVGWWAWLSRPWSFRTQTTPAGTTYWTVTFAWRR